MSGSKGVMTGRKALSSLCNACRHHQLGHQTRRGLSYTTVRKAESGLAALEEAAGERSRRNTTSSQREAPRSGARTANPTVPPRQPLPGAASRQPPINTRSSSPGATSLDSLFSAATTEASTRIGAGTPKDEPYHIHVYAHKHNTHITFSEPTRNPIMSFSCGNIGLRKAQRSSFDAAYQLATYAMKKLAMASWRQGGKKMTQNPMRTIRDIGSGVGIEVIMRGFGPGREAFQKALLGSEGSLFRGKIRRVTDATRLKFGGARSPAVRRL